MVVSAFVRYTVARSAPLTQPVTAFLINSRAVQREGADALSPEEHLALLCPGACSTHDLAAGAREYLALVQPHKGNVLSSPADVAAALDLSPSDVDLTALGAAPHGGTVSGGGGVGSGGVFGPGGLDAYRPTDRLPSLNVHNATTRGDSPVDTPLDTPASRVNGATAPASAQRAASGGSAVMSPQLGAAALQQVSSPALQTKGSTAAESSGSDAAPGQPENAHSNSDALMRTAPDSFSAGSASPPPLLPTNSKGNNAQGGRRQGGGDAELAGGSGSKGPGSLAAAGKQASRSAALERSQGSTGEDAVTCC